MMRTQSVLERSEDSDLNLVLSGLNASASVNGEEKVC